MDAKHKRCVYVVYSAFTTGTKKLYSMISYQLPTDNNFEELVKDERFTSRFVCPHCGCISKLKKFMDRFNGVATKYLNNYLIWHKWYDTKGHTQLEKADLLLIKAISYAISVHFRRLSMRPTIPIMA